MHRIIPFISAVISGPPFSWHQKPAFRSDKRHKTYDHSSKAELAEINQAEILSNAASRSEMNFSNMLGRMQLSKSVALGVSALGLRTKVGAQSRKSLTRAPEVSQVAAKSQLDPNTGTRSVIDQTAKPPLLFLSSPQFLLTSASNSALNRRLSREHWFGPELKLAPCIGDRRNAQDQLLASHDICAR